MPTIEERKIALEEKWFELKKEIALARLKENKQPTAPPHKPIDPIMATIVVAIIGFIATTVGTVINNHNMHELEEQKFETELIKKSIDQPNRDDIIKSLKLLTTLKLIHNDEVKNALDSFLADTSAAKNALPGFATVPVSKVGRDSLFNSYITEFGNLKDNQRLAISKLFDFISSDTTIKDVRHVAFILATIKRETANTFVPLVEMGSDDVLEKRYGKETGMGRSMGNVKEGDGAKYKGRGYIQLTGYRNYMLFNKRLNLENTDNDIVKDPTLALDPVVAYRITSELLISGFLSGGKRKLSQFINDQQTDYINAQRIVTGGLAGAAQVAADAQKFERILRKSLMMESSAQPAKN
jgi:putative chitinase